MFRGQKEAQPQGEQECQGRREDQGVSQPTVLLLDLGKRQRQSHDTEHGLRR